MMTAVSILRECTDRASESLRPTLKGSEPYIHFESGYTSTIVDALTRLAQSRVNKPFPCIAVFTENLTETQADNWLDIVAPKIAIVVPTAQNKTEQQRIRENFEPVLYPILREFTKQLRNYHYGYGFQVQHKDIPFFTESRKAHTFNDMIDGIVITNLKLRVLNEIIC